MIPKTKHIILRSSLLETQGNFGLAMPQVRSMEATEPVISLEVAEIAPRDVSNLKRDGNVLAIAPIMPMRLISPVGESVDTAPALGMIGWGIKAVGANTSRFTGDSVIVAVLDTGIDPKHPAFAGVTLERKNFTDEIDDDIHGHGTHCAGTIFGRDIAGTRIGVARGIKRVLIGKVLGKGGGTSDRIADAIQWAVSERANVISMSLGIDFPGLVRELENTGLPTELATSRALEGYRLNVQLFERLTTLVRTQGVFSGQPTLIIAAAGNESRRNLNPNFKIAVSPPAVSDGILSVAALGLDIDSKLAVADFSNTGATLSGPGVDIVSAKFGSQGLVAMSGTSMATPHIAGLAALWAEKIKQTSPLGMTEWMGRLIGSATTGGMASEFDPSDVGAGLVHAPQN